MILRYSDLISAEITLGKYPATAQALLERVFCRTLDYRIVEDTLSICKAP